MQELSQTGADLELAERELVTSEEDVSHRGSGDTAPKLIIYSYCKPTIISHSIFQLVR